MARISNGYIVVVDQGDPARNRPVLYIQVKFPGMHRVLTEDHLLITEDPHDCTVFKLEKPGHCHALELAEVKFPDAVPVSVTITRNITIHLELPDDSSHNCNRQRASIQLP